MALHERKAKKPKKLTREQKKLIYSRPKENAGAGWAYGKGCNPITFEKGRGHGRD